MKPAVALLLLTASPEFADTCHALREDPPWTVTFQHGAEKDAVPGRGAAAALELGSMSSGAGLSRMAAADDDGNIYSFTAVDDTAISFDDKVYKLGCRQ
ncbi:hypothetical protein ACHMW7_09175 [Aminobacter sp. UC22_36]|uniref:hypothetical protein n=1 Tax=Aminobacter sp. UC22_36 TaxID=3374549 RepID=UPI0037573802